MPREIYVNGNQQAQEVFVKHNGVWKSATEVWVNDAGTWKQVYPAEPGNIEYTAPGTYLFTVPAGITSLTCTVVGAGGGGGGLWNPGDAWSGAGGGSGGLYSNQTIAVVPGTVLQVVVGAGGAGGSYLSTGTWVCVTSQGYTFNGAAGGYSAIVGWFQAEGGSGAGNPVAGGPVGYGGSPSGVNGSYAAVNCLNNLPGGSNGTGYGSGGMGGSCVNPYSGGCGQTGQDGYVRIAW